MTQSQILGPSGQPIPATSPKNPSATAAQFAAKITTKSRRMGPIKLLSLAIVGAAGVAVIGVWRANLLPYSEFFSFIPGLGGVTGVSFFFVVQGLEMLPNITKLLRNVYAVTAEFLQTLNRLWWVALFLDTYFCLKFWPPIRVSFAEFAMAWKLSMIDGDNLAKFLITLFGGWAVTALLTALLVPQSKVLGGK